jgi:Flp pilus assembly protein protease CpaA
VQPQELGQLAFQIAATVWMLAIAVIDHRTARIPNWLVAPVMLGVGGIRLVQAVLGEWRLLFLFLAWAIIFVLWMLHFMGGGDAKFLMGLFALFPTDEWVAVLALFLLILTVPLFLWELRGRSFGEIRQSLQGRLITGQVLPTEQELQVRGRQYAWTFAVPGIIYTWLYW